MIIYELLKLKPTSFMCLNQSKFDNLRNINIKAQLISFIENFYLKKP